MSSITGCTPALGTILMFGPATVGQKGVIQSMIALGGGNLESRIASYSSADVLSESFAQCLGHMKGGLSFAILVLWNGTVDHEILHEQICSPLLTVLDAAHVPLLLLIVGTEDDRPTGKWWQRNQKVLASMGCTPTQALCVVHPVHILSAIETHALPEGVSLAPFVRQFESVLRTSRCCSSEQLNCFGAAKSAMQESPSQSVTVYDGEPNATEMSTR